MVFTLNIRTSSRLTLWVKFSADDILKQFSYFPQKTGVDISCKQSPMEAFCMKCQILFSGKNMKKIFQYDVCWKFYPEWYFFLLFFSQKSGSDISCKLSPICRKCQILFSGKWFDSSCKLSPMEIICMKCQILLSGKTFYANCLQWR